MISNERLYLQEKMTEQMGEMFDLAVHEYEMEGDRFWDAFVSSGRAEQFEEKNVRYVLGKSGSENVKEILEESSGVPADVKIFCREDRSPEYWAGWILGEYQNHSGISYRQMHRLIRYRELLSMYRVYHEAPPERFFEEMDARRCNRPTGLKRQRENRGLSQSQLARESGVSLKSIQAYEQGWKDIRRAKAESLFALAGVLRCRAEDLME